MLTNTGAPQGTVLSAFLFLQYTAHSMSSHNKFADGTGWITDDDDSYYNEADKFVDCCEEGNFVLNVGEDEGNYHRF